MDSMITVREAAQELGVSSAAVRVAIHEGRLIVQRVGKRVFVPRDEVYRYQQRRDARSAQKSACVAVIARGSRPAGVRDLDWEMMQRYAVADVTLQDIADSFGLTRERVRQRIERGLRLSQTAVPEA